MSDQKLTWRVVVGRALSSGVLGMAAGAALMFYPDIGLIPMVGLAALIASIGTSGLERIFQSFIGKR